MRLLSGELLKLRHRWATYIVLALLVGLMALVMLLAGLSSRAAGPAAASFLRFPQTYGVINQFVFGLGSLLAVAYAAAIAGADWNWGMLRVIIARGESRSRYTLAKALGLAVVLLLGVVVAFGAGMALTYMASGLAGVSAGDPFGGRGTRDIIESVGLGFPVLAERAAIGFAVATLLRSQLAGIVVGIVLYIGESILSAVLVAMTFAGSLFGGGPGAVGPEWFQFLPFSIGDSVLAAAPGVTGELEGFLLRPVPVETALMATLVYLSASLAVAAVSVERAQISG